MLSDYDENIRDNPFFQRMLRLHSDDIHEACCSDQQVAICVPKFSALGASQTTTKPNTTTTSTNKSSKRDLLDYIMIGENVDANIQNYKSLSGRSYKIEASSLHVLTDNGNELARIAILFTETFYERGGVKYKVLCTESHLDSSNDLSRNHAKSTLTSATDCIDLLWHEHSDRNAVISINAMVRKLLENEGHLLELQPLTTLKDLFQTVYEDSLRVAIRIQPADRESMFQLKIAVETCVQYCCEHQLFDAVCTSAAKQDAYLNKITRNLQELSLKDFNIDTKFHNHMVNVRIELSKINKFVTVLEKGNCIKKAFNLLTQCVRNVTASDFLQVLIYLVVRLNVNNWHANLWFLTHFHFSTSEISGEFNFLIASLEAAVEYIKNGNCSLLQLSPSTLLSNEAIGKNILQNLYRQIEQNNLDAVKAILSDNNNRDSQLEMKLCHPLCSCDNCEVLIKDDAFNNYCHINSVDDAGRTPLHVAARAGNPLIVEYLLQLATDVGPVDVYDHTPADYASQRGNQHALLLLLHANADPHRSDGQGNTALHHASHHGHDNCVKAYVYYSELVGGLTAAVNARNHAGETALHLAARWGFTSIVSLLLQHGADAGVLSKKRLSALDVAHNYYVRHLLVHYEKPDVRDHNDDSGQTWKANAANPSLRVSLRRKSSVKKCSDLDKTCESNATASCGVKYGTRPKNLDQYKRTDRLLHAIEKNDLPLTCYYLGIPNPQEIVTKVDNVNGNGNNGRVDSRCHPLCDCPKCVGTTEGAPQADTLQHIDVTHVANHSSLHINVCNGNGHTALHVAAQYGRSDLVRLLLDAGADVNVVTYGDHQTALHLACREHRATAVRQLVQCGGCSIDAVDAAGNTALYYAAVDGSGSGNANGRIVEMLVAHGANGRLRNPKTGKSVDDVVSERMLHGAY